MFVNTSTFVFIKLSIVSNLLAKTFAVFSPTCSIPSANINFSNEFFLDSSIAPSKLLTLLLPNPSSSIKSSACFFK